jgi:hypothetical protein
MTQITTWIAALMLTGSPVTTSLWAVVCGHASVPTAHCHESVTESVPPTMSSEATCAAATGDVSYVKEDVAAPQVAGAPATMSLPPVPSTCTLVAAGLDVPVVTGWLAPRLVRRL